MTNQIDQLAEEIRRIDGDHTMGAGALAEGLVAAGWVLIPETDEKLDEFFKEGADPSQGARLQGFINYALRKHAAAAAPEHKPLKGYKLKDYVVVLKDGLFVNGRVSGFSQNQTNIHVDTERGPVTIQNPSRIKPQ